MDTNKKTPKAQGYARSGVYNPLCTDVLVDENVNVFHWSIR